MSSGPLALLGLHAAHVLGAPELLQLVRHPRVGGEDDDEQLIEIPGQLANQVDGMIRHFGIATLGNHRPCLALQHGFIVVVLRLLVNLHVLGGGPRSRPAENPPPRGGRGLRRRLRRLFLELLLRIENLGTEGLFHDEHRGARGFEHSAEVGAVDLRLRVEEPDQPAALVVDLAEAQKGARGRLDHWRHVAHLGREVQAAQGRLVRHEHLIHVADVDLSGRVFDEPQEVELVRDRLHAGL
mmetsp:Transcript_32548/g.103667  ORF Transcript_32548/g.103667 Transcript_32548/m.103667 type:complete len:240 (+) Transcript_32548:665-1384(+)